MPPKQVRAGAAIRGQLQRLGVYRESGHEHFYGCLTAPLLNAQCELVQMYGRRIGKVAASDAPRHMYMKGPHRGVFNLPALHASKDIIVCEALLDAMTFWCAGFRNVTSAYGVEGFTPELREALGAYGIERVLIAYDADDAGNRAAEKLAPELAAMGLSVFCVNFPKGMRSYDREERGERRQCRVPLPCARGARRTRCAEADGARGPRRHCEVNGACCAYDPLP